MRKILILPVCWIPVLFMPALAADPVTDPVTVFKDGEQVVKSVSLSQMKDLASPSKLKVWEPQENKDVTYEGYPLTQVLDKAFGGAWKKRELVLFVCSDGYKAPIPRANIESERSLLAFRRLGSNFEVHSRDENGKVIPLGPLYLVWNNLKNPQIRAEGAVHWPYQIVGIELADFASKFPHMIPPASASAQTRAGFTSFQKYCMACHKVNGDGGDRGPELNSPVSVTERPGARAWLVSWIDNPGKSKPGTVMPPLNTNVPARAQAISDIVSYLEEMAKHKTALSK